MNPRIAPRGHQPVDPPLDRRRRQPHLGADLGEASPARCAAGSRSPCRRAVHPSLLTQQIAVQPSQTQHTGAGHATERRLLARSPRNSVRGTRRRRRAAPSPEEFLVTAVLPRPRAAAAAERVATPRRYLMCRPEHFDVSYAINPWMDVDPPVDRELAIAPVGDAAPDLPRPRPRGRADRPRAGPARHGVRRQRRPGRRGPRRSGARFTHAERRAEGPAYLALVGRRGLKDVTEPVHVNEGEGDFLVAGDLVLAGTGFRTDPGAHAEAQELFGVPVISLQLVDPRFYHLDTALAVLDDAHGRVLPGGVLPGQPRRPAAAVPGRDPGHRGRRRGARPERGLRRPPRRAAVGGRRPGRRSCASAATSRSASTSPSCSRPAAAPSAAPWRSAPERLAPIQRTASSARAPRRSARAAVSAA